MSHLTRRQLISGLAATTAAFSIGCRKESKQAESQQPQPEAAKLAAAAARKQLNVFLHGLMVVGVLQPAPSKDEGIRLVFPNIPAGLAAGSPAHKYLAGNVKTTKPGDTDLKPFPPGTNQLRGLLQGSHPDFSTDPSTFFLQSSGDSLTLDEPNKRVIVMPWPKAIASVKKMYVKPNPPSPTCETSSPLVNAPRGDARNGNLKSISTIHILTYDCDSSDIKGPRFLKPDQTDLGWIPQFTQLPSPCTDVPTANLHIFAEPQETVTNADHVVHAFHELMATIKKKSGGDLSKDYSFKRFTIGDAKLCPSDGKCRPGIQDIDLFNLTVLHSASEGGEVANCVHGVINLG